MQYIENIHVKILNPHTKINNFVRRFLNLYGTIRIESSKNDKKMEKEAKEIDFLCPTVGAKNVYAECGLKLHTHFNIVIL